MRANSSMERHMGKRARLDYPEFFTYVGEHRDGRSHGLGVSENHSTGEIYEGFVVNSMKHGQGKLVKSDGTVVEGTWEDNGTHRMMVLPTYPL